MKHLKFNYLLITLLFSTVALTSCDRDDDNNHRNISPITLGSSVTVTNTF